MLQRRLQAKPKQTFICVSQDLEEGPAREREIEGYREVERERERERGKRERQQEYTHAAGLHNFKSLSHLPVNILGL